MDLPPIGDSRSAVRQAAAIIRRSSIRQPVPTFPINCQTTRLPNYQIRLGVEPLAAEGLGIDEEVRLRHHVESNRSDGLPHRVGELVVVAEQVQARTDG